MVNGHRKAKTAGSATLSCGCRRAEYSGGGGGRSRILGRPSPPVVPHHQTGSPVSRACPSGRQQHGMGGLPIWSGRTPHQRQSTTHPSGPPTACIRRCRRPASAAAAEQLNGLTTGPHDGLSSRVTRCQLALMIRAARPVRAEVDCGGLR